MRALGPTLARRRRPGLTAYLSCIRYRDVVVLQGSPLLGFIFASPALTVETAWHGLLLAVASVLLVAHVFAFNDWVGAAADARDPNKAASLFLTKGVSRLELGVLSLILLVTSLAVFTILPMRTLATAVAIAALSTAYSHPGVNAKGTPLLSSVPHLLGGVLHFLLGYSVVAPVDRRGMLIGLFFALTFTAGHLNQEVRDHEGDRAAGHRTNAVAFGPTRTFIAGLVVFTMAYADLSLLAWMGLVPALLGWLPPMLYPIHAWLSLRTLGQELTFESVSRFQSRYRVLYGVIGAVMLAAIALR